VINDLCRAIYRGTCAVVGVGKLLAVLFFLGLLVIGLPHAAWWEIGRACLRS
jgi:hypothetical protein